MKRRTLSALWYYLNSLKNDDRELKMIRYKATSKLSKNLGEIEHIYDENTGEGYYLFEEDVTSIPDIVFASCTSLTSIEIPNSVTSIGESAFSGCTSLTSLTIPNSVTSIGHNAFYGCTNLTSVTINSDAIVNKTYTSSSNIKNIFGNQVKEYVVGGNVINIGDYAFYECNGLTSVTIGNGVIEIGQYAFSNCKNLIFVLIGNSVTNIGESAFATPQTESLISQIIIPKSVTFIGEGAFGNVSGKIIFTKLYPTYTSKINLSFTQLLGGSVPFKLVFDVSEVPENYNISSMLMTATDSDKNKFNYNIYTDNIIIKDQALAMANTKTIVNVYHIDGTRWN